MYLQEPCLNLLISRCVLVFYSSGLLLSSTPQGFLSHLSVPPGTLLEPLNIQVFLDCPGGRVEPLLPVQPCRDLGQVATLACLDNTVFYRLNQEV